MKRFKALMSLFVVAMTGCYSTYDPYYYDYAYYDPYYYGYDAYYAYSWVDPYGVYYYSAPTPMQNTIDLNAAATAIANRADAYYTPAGCAVATASGPTVNYTFNNCEGAFGLTSVSGAVKLELSESNGQLVLTGTSTDLTAGGHPFVLDLKATATRSGTQRAVTMTSHSHATDQVDSRDAQITMTWEQGSGCVTMNGQSGSTRGDKTVTSTITNYQRCQNQCPSAGKVTVDGKDGAFTTEFNGTSTVKVTGPNGDTKTYDFQCQ
ncbi:hypothetical protein [Vitiosangium sp. GDMCC 1.1324]|uniref:hypothetical protein n=1 Tax=Vitiosangium sp. (strain GDMCC 1.1324) TaxID=2138576 RepID=UPI000D3DA525|nr:hypothetical protein [Vitiosangium sp. GDMCC 1.1324]PTL79480.1 hypothetical protein DAT35_32195 [Vitiosangium sp. GDMCC 1.1324]